MTVKILKNLFVLLGLGIVVLTRAQVLTVHTIDSVDLTIVRAKTVVVGQISSVKESPDAHHGLQCDATILVKETLKGTKHKSIQTRLQGSIEQFEPIRINASNLLVALTEDNTFQPTTFFDLAAKPFLACRSDFTLVRDSGTFLQIVRVLAAKNPENQDITSEHISCPGNERGKSWEAAFARIGPINLGVPLDKSVETLAWLDFSSSEQGFQAEGARLIRNFKSDENIARLKTLLKSSVYMVVGSPEYSFGNEDRYYMVRNLAFDVLLGWGVREPEPVTREIHSQLDMVQRLSCGKGLTSEHLVSFQTAKKLRTLEIHFRYLDHDQMGLIGRLTQLTDIKLYGFVTDDIGISRLSGLLNLESLTIGNDVAITEACLPTIAGLPKLKTVTLAGNKISADAITAFRAAHPNLNVISN